MIEMLKKGKKQERQDMKKRNEGEDDSETMSKADLAWLLMLKL
jgi:hypothetical protein